MTTLPPRLLTAAFFCLVTAATALGQTGPRLALEPLPDNRNAVLAHETLFIESGQTDNGTELNLQWHEQAGRVTVGEKHRAGARLTWIHLETLDPRVPERLVDTAVGWSMPLGDSGRTGLVAGAGYAGSTPFSDGDGWYGEAAITHQVPDGPGREWLFTLSYNGNRVIFPDVPLPTVSLRHEVSDTLTYTIGVPISSLRWQPAPGLSVSARYLAPVSVDATVTWHAADRLDVFATIESRTRAFNIDDGPDHRRYLLRQRRAEAGLRVEPADGMTAEVAGGYAFGGEIETGWDVRETDSVTDMSDEPYGRVGITLAF